MAPTSVFGADVQAVFDAVSTARTKSVPIDGGSRDISVPFASPTDWRDTWIYFLMMDRFNNPSAPPPSTTGKPPISFAQPFGAFQAGTFQRVPKKLRHLHNLAVDAICHYP